MLLFDSHCHLDLAPLAEQAQALWGDCQRDGIQQLLIPSVTLANFPRIQTLAEQLPGVVWAAGLHPWWVAEFSEDLSALREALQRAVQHPACVAIGECGLDGAIELPLETQLPYLEAQLAVASESQRPVVLHQRNAHNLLIQTLKRFTLPAGGVVHGFSGSLQMAQEYLKLGLSIGVGGVITYPRAAKTRRAIAELPLESLLLETDAPDMPLSGHQGEPNSPLRLLQVAEALAELKGVPVADIARQTTDNSRRLFQLG